MSAEIKPGQIWAWKPGSTSYKEGTEVLITSVGDANSPDDRDVWYEYPDGSQEPQWRTRDGVLADMMFVRDATPAPLDPCANRHDFQPRWEGDNLTRWTCAVCHSPRPTPPDPSKGGYSPSDPYVGGNHMRGELDPSKVKAGDTVTLEKGTAKHTDLVNNVDQYQDGDYRFKSATSPTHVYRVGEGAWTLTAHQPAPVPEPEWKPGTVAIVTPSMWGGIVNRALRGTDGGWYTEAGGHWDDDEVSDVHQLVVIDPAAVDVDALTTTFHNASHYGVDLPLEGAAYLARVARTFFVGGESR